MARSIIAKEGYYSRVFNKGRDYLWPIPYVQTQENPNLEQNPNYQ